MEKESADCPVILSSDWAEDLKLMEILDSRIQVVEFPLEREVLVEEGYALAHLTPH